MDFLQTLYNLCMVNKVKEIKARKAKKHEHRWEFVTCLAVGMPVYECQVRGCTGQRIVKEDR